MESLELEERKKYTDSILMDLILGLNHFHTLNINVTHQDIKENNIAYDGEHFRYIDWGGCCTEASKPCSYIGTRYTAPPELVERIHYIASTARETYKQTYPNASDTQLQTIYENEFNEHIRDPHPFVWQKAHDIWSLGVIFLRWFTETKDIEEYYDFTDNDIENRLKDTSYVVSYIIKAFLDKDLSARVNNFKEIVNILNEGIVLSLKSERSDISYLYRYILEKKCENTDTDHFDNIVAFKDPIDRNIYCIDKYEIANDPIYEFDNTHNTFVNRWVDNSLIKLSDSDADDIRKLRNVSEVKPPSYSPYESSSSLEEGEIRVPKRLPPGLFSPNAPPESSKSKNSFKEPSVLASPFIYQERKSS
jgi:hypothetical protein